MEPTLPYRPVPSEDPSSASPWTESRGHDDATTKKYFKHSSAKRVNTDAVLAQALRAQYPTLQLVVTPEETSPLLAYAGAGHASYAPIDDEPGQKLPGSLSWKVYVPPARRLDGGVGALASRLVYGRFVYRWQGTEFILYLADGRDGTGPYPLVTNYYLLTPDAAKAHALLLAAGVWAEELHGEVWVFDQGYWQKSRELYQSVENSTWDDVILDEGMKKAIIADHMSFFEGRDSYTKLKVPWKRGIIYHGPPGNGKTVSIKAMMHSLYGLKTPIPTMYVRSLVSVSCRSPQAGPRAEADGGRPVRRSRVLDQAHLQQGPPGGAVLPRLRGPRHHRVGHGAQLLPQ